MAGVNTLVGSVRQTDIHLQVSNRSWEWGRSSDPLSHPSIHPLFFVQLFYPSSIKLAGWWIAVASSQHRPSFSLAIHPSFACLLYLISAKISTFHPSLPHAGQCLNNSWHWFIFLLYSPHSWPLLSVPSIIIIPSFMWSAGGVSICLYALSGTDPLHPSVKRTKALGLEPAGLDSV